MVIQTIQTVISCLFPIIGVICVLLPRYVTTILPYLLGGTMILAGIFKVWNDIQNRKIFNQYPYELAHGMILLIMGTAFVLQGSKALGPIGTTWAIIGIRKASISLGTAIQKIDQKERFAAPILEFLLRITLALILLFDPFEKFSTHIMILGFELIFSHYVEYTQASSALILYRVATFFFPFVLSIFVFLRVQKRVMNDSEKT